MGVAKIIEYGLAFLKWCWINKWTILFIITTIIFLTMYGCEKRVSKKLTDELTIKKAEYVICQSNYTTTINANKDVALSLDICKKELDITKKSYKDAEVLISQFDLEIQKFKKLAEEIDNTTDPEKALEKKKKIIEELFKGRNAIQIRTTIRSL